MSLAAGFVDIGTFIDQREGYRGGRPFIAGTGVTVDRVSVLHRIDRLAPEEIADELNLTMPQVLAALAFYLANQRSFDTFLEEYDAETEQVAAEYYKQHGHLKAHLEN